MLENLCHKVVEILPLLFVMWHKLRKAVTAIIATESQAEMLLMG